MSRNIALLFFAGLLLLPGVRAGAQEGLEDDTVFRAMSDELTRSVESLQMEGVQRPFYVEYTVMEWQNVTISASFGALDASSLARKRILIPDVRVGDYTIDNTNSGQGGLFGMFSGFGGTPTLSLEDDYDALRHAIWLATDSSYKGAAEALAQKKARLQSMNAPDLPDDLSREEPHTYVGDPYVLEVDRKGWEKKMTRLSGVFREYPAIQKSGVIFYGGGGTQRFVNSEGFWHRYGDAGFVIGMNAAAQAEDGMWVRLGSSHLTREIEDLPDEETLSKEAKALADKVTRLAGAPVGEEYTGPVLFEGGAAAQFFVQLFLKNVTDAREPLQTMRMPGMDMFSAKLSEKVGKKVMADFLDVVDDPTLEEFEGRRLVGGYPVDDDGVKPQKIQLVEEGKLLTLPMSRIPTRDVKKSNGHARGSIQVMPAQADPSESVIALPPVGNPSNVIIRPKEGRSDEDLKKELISLCEDEGLEYGLVIRSLASPMGGLADMEFLMDLFSQVMQGGGGRPSALRQRSTRSTWRTAARSWSGGSGLARSTCGR